MSSVRSGQRVDCRGGPRLSWVWLTVWALLLLGCASRGNEGATTPSVVDAGAFDRVWTAKGVDSRGAPVEPTTQFTVNDATLYVVAEIAALPAGTIFARWERDGQPYEDSTPLDILEPLTAGYVHFYLRPDGGATTLEPGHYRVTLMVNGDPSNSIEFQISP